MITMNGLSPQILAEQGSALPELATHALGSGETELIDSLDGQKLLSYIAACALPAEGAAIFDLGGGDTLEFEGRLGFAPGWSSGVLDATGKRWVSACILAHVNAFSIPVPMSLRAAVLDEPSLEDAELYEIEEAAFYGDLFADNPADRYSNACFGWHVAALFGYDGDIDEDTLDYLHFRVCSTSDGCGFNRVGSCFDWGPPILGTASKACDDVDAAIYLDCHERPVGDGETKTWPETVTVNLQRTDFDRQVEEYQAADTGCVISDSPLSPLDPILSDPVPLDPIPSGSINTRSLGRCSQIE